MNEYESHSPDLPTPAVGGKAKAAGPRKGKAVDKSKAVEKLKAPTVDNAGKGKNKIVDKGKGSGQVQGNVSLYLPRSFLI
jgi:hypothetical protein